MTDITELAQLRAELSNPAIGTNSHLRKVALSLVETLEKAQGMESYWKTQCRGITDHSEKLQAQIEQWETLNAQFCSNADADISALRQRIAELESRTVTVKLPEPFKLAKSSSGLTYYYADEVNEALTAQGIKWEAE